MFQISHIIIKIYIIHYSGVGSFVNIAQLNAMASDPDSEYVHLVPNMAAVVNGNVTDAILDHACHRCSMFLNT